MGSPARMALLQDLVNEAKADGFTMEWVQLQLPRVGPGRGIAMQKAPKGPYHVSDGRVIGLHPGEDEIRKVPHGSGVVRHLIVRW